MPSIEDRSSPPPPQTVLEAADATTDLAVLELLWEITKRRLDEERHRQDSANDRASKCITFAFSILATGGILSYFTKDLFKEGVFSESLLVYLFLAAMIFAMAASLFFTFYAWNAATNAINIKNYKTWHEKDLSLVHLGDGDAEDSEKQHAYLRHQIKATWACIPENETNTNDKMDAIAGSLKYLKRAFIAAFSLVILNIPTNIFVEKSMVEREKRERIEREQRNWAKWREMMNMSVQSNHGGSGASNPKQITPTPKPTTGQPLKKSEDPAPRPIQPTPNPTGGHPLKENNGRNGGKK